MLNVEFLIHKNKDDGPSMSKPHLRFYDMEIPLCSITPKKHKKINQSQSIASGQEARQCMTNLSWNAIYVFFVG